MIDETSDRAVPPEDRYDWIVPRVEGAKRVPEYEHKERADEVWRLWQAGYDEEEIAENMGIAPSDVRRDMAYMKSRMPTNALVAQNADRMQVRLQEQVGEAFHNQVKAIANMTIADMVELGISPDRIIKEVRAALGVGQGKNAPQVKIDLSRTNNTMTTHDLNQQINLAVNAKIRGTEDIIRGILEAEESAQLIEGTAAGEA